MTNEYHKLFKRLFHKAKNNEANVIMADVLNKAYEDLTIDERIVLDEICDDLVESVKSLQKSNYPKSKPVFFSRANAREVLASLAQYVEG